MSLTPSSMRYACQAKIRSTHARVGQRQSQPLSSAAGPAFTQSSLIRPTPRRSIAYRLQHVPANSSRRCRLGIIESHTMSTEPHDRQHELRRRRHVSRLYCVWAALQRLTSKPFTNGVPELFFDTPRTAATQSQH